MSEDSKEIKKLIEQKIESEDNSNFNSSEENDFFEEEEDFEDKKEKQLNNKKNSANKRTSTGKNREKNKYMNMFKEKNGKNINIIYPTIFYIKNKFTFFMVNKIG